MNILVVSYSTIVIELLKLVFKESSIKNEHVKSISEAKDDSYNIIFVDDSTHNFSKEIEEIVDNFSYNKLVFIGNANGEIEDLANEVVKKPFLPKDIKNILEDTSRDKPEAKTKVLDAEEIARIKALMDIDEEDEEEYKSFKEMLEDKESFSAKKKDAKGFLYECTKLSKKELKKLLKGAKVSIKVEYKSEDYE